MNSVVSLDKNKVAGTAIYNSSPALHFAPTTVNFNEFSEKILGKINNVRDVYVKEYK